MSKKQLQTVCFIAATALAVMSLVGLLFVRPLPGWTTSALLLGVSLNVLGLILKERAERSE